MMMLAEVIIVVVRGHLSGGQDMTGAAAPTAGAPQGAGTDRNAGSTLTELSGMVAVTEVCEQLRMVELLDAAVGPIKVRRGGIQRGTPDHFRTRCQGITTATAILRRGWRPVGCVASGHPG